MLTPMGSRIWLVPDPTHDTTESGLIIPETAQEAAQTAIVKAVGRGPQWRHDARVEAYRDCLALLEHADTLQEGLDLLRERLDAVRASGVPSEVGLGARVLLDPHQPLSEVTLDGETGWLVSEDHILAVLEPDETVDVEIVGVAA